MSTYLEESERKTLEKEQEKPVVVEKEREERPKQKADPKTKPK